MIQIEIENYLKLFASHIILDVLSKASRIVELEANLNSKIISEEENGNNIITINKVSFLLLFFVFSFN